MSELLLPAATAALLMMAALLARQRTIAGRRELIVCLIIGALWFLFQTQFANFEFLLPVLLAGPYAVNRAFRAAFERSLRPLWFESMTLSALLIFGVFGYVWPGLPWAMTSFNLLSLALFAELPFIVWRALANDLVESRRRVELLCLAAAALLSLAIALPSMLGSPHMAAVFGACATLLLCVAATAFSRRLLEPIRTPPPLPASPLIGRELLVLRRLEAVMTDDAAWRDPGLTLSSLASRLTVPEHRLRRVIHLGAGHGHFSTYISAFRLAEIKRRLDDPTCDAINLLDLATDAGYNSLSAFNRAFRISEDTTPSAYRAARKAARTASAPANMANTAESPSAL